MAKVVINFESDEAAKGFSDWLNDQGEQQYWEYMECQDNPEIAETFKYGPLKKGEIRIEAK